MICEKCLKKIKVKGDYFKVEFYDKGKLVSTKYIHKECHLDMEHQKQKLGKVANRLMDNLQNMMGGKKVVEIK